ncbi:MAG: peptidylprolyl isomerase [Gemmatimonadaceae bacterium]|nr:peptidylprolyl isomerase [Gemmatimonadaceae bacterium]
MPTPRTSSIRPGVPHRSRCPHFALWLLIAVTPLALSTRPAHAQADSASSLSPAQRRALLLAPTRAFWKAKAPDTVALDVETSRGTFTIELIREWAPNGVDRFYNLARAGFFDDSRFYRVLPFYIAQFGHPASPAIGATWRDRKLRPDSVRTSNERGTLTYAQFTPRDRATTLFINLRDNVNLDTLGFAPIGRVIEGIEVADSLYGGYGEIPASPAPMGNPRRFYGESNRFLDKEYPKLDRILSITVRSSSSARRP